MKLLIPYNSHKFPSKFGSKLLGPNTLKTTWTNIMISAITVGKINKFDVFRADKSSLLEILMRVAIIRSSLKRDGFNYLKKAKTYKTLDPSEKVAYSYYQGLMTSNLFLTKLLGIKWPIHLDVYGYLFNVVTSKGRSRPDMIARTNSNEWVVIESKGRSDDFSKKAMDKGKEQTRKIKTINGNIPKLRVVTQSYFKDDYFKVELEDADGFDKDSLVYNFYEKEYLYTYYKDFLNLFNNNEHLHKVRKWNNLILIELSEIDITIGINKEIMDSFEYYYNDINFDFINNVLEERPPFREELNTKQSIYNTEGIYVQLGDSWLT